MEFMLLTGTLMMVLVVLLVVATTRGGQLAQDTLRLQLENTADDIAREVHYASLAGNGYSRIFELPPQIAGRNYSVDVMVAVSNPDSGATLQVEYSTGEVSSVVLPLPYRVAASYGTASYGNKARVDTSIWGQVTLQLPNSVMPKRCWPSGNC